MNSLMMASSRKFLHLRSVLLTQPVIPHYLIGGHDIQIRACLFSTASQKDDWLLKNQANDEGKIISKRQEFQQIPVHPSILQYIEMIGVGIPPRQNHRRKYNMVLSTVGSRRGSRGANRKKELDEGEEQSRSPFWKPPPPFGPDSDKVQIVGSVGTEDLIRGNENEQESDQESKGLFSLDDNVVIEFPKNRTMTPEVALAGRSNVGKSTLLNALLYGNRNPDTMQRDRHQRGRTPVNMKLPKGIKASMSNLPGETRRITFYQLQSTIEKPITKETGSEENTERSVIESRRMMLVDLPGYGFAYASEEERANFQRLMVEYLLFRGKALKRLLVLIDARHGMKKADIEFLTLLQQTERKYHDPKQKKRSKTGHQRQPRLPAIQLVLTKCDLVSQSDLARRVSQVRQQLSECLIREPSQCAVMLVSARPGVGYNNVVGNRAKGGVLQLQKELAALASPSSTLKKKSG